MFNVATPVLTDKPEWTLNGQMLNVTLPLQDTVSMIKTKIHELTGMPPGKQKLQCDVCKTFKLKHTKLINNFYNIFRDCFSKIQIR